MKSFYKTEQAAQKAADKHNKDQEKEGSPFRWSVKPCEFKKLHNDYTVETLRGYCLKLEPKPVNPHIEINCGLVRTKY